MIEIVNVSENPSQFGVNEYEVRVNGEVKASFKHKRTDGLGRCLLEASKAVERDKWMKAAKELLQYRPEGADGDSTRRK